jgi:transposase InsO family protein
MPLAPRPPGGGKRTPGSDPAEARRSDPELEARRLIYDYIEVNYNRQRRHTTLNYQTPAEYASVETHS